MKNWEVLGRFDAIINITAETEEEAEEMARNKSFQEWDILETQIIKTNEV